MNLYVTRHGETSWNAENKVCGVTDIDLTENGIHQAAVLAEKLSDKNIDLIISSPLKRARQTASKIAENVGAPIITDDRLTEQDYGIYEGVDRADERFLSNKRNFAFKYPGGESMMQVAYRTYGLIEEVKEKHGDKNVLFVCHGGVCRVINTYFKDITNDDFFHYSLENCGLESYVL